MGRWSRASRARGAVGEVDTNGHSTPSPASDSDWAAGNTPDSAPGNSGRAASPAAGAGSGPAVRAIEPPRQPTGPDVAVAPEPAKAGRKSRGDRPRGRLRARVLPRTVLGTALLILAASVGAAFSGAVLYSYYQYRLQKTDDRVNALVNGYKKEFDKASADLAAQRDAAKAQIAAQLAPLQALQASPQTLQDLVKKVAPSVWFVHTLDENGAPSVGSAFAVASDQSRTLLLTSYATVLAATRKPGPQLFVRQGTVDTPVSVWTWDERYDLALLVLPKGGLPVLHAAAPAPAIGQRVFAVSGLGSLGASASDGIVTDVSADAIQHTAAIGPAFQGGPLLDASGNVLGISSRAYQPLNFASDGVWFAPFVQSACARVLQCPAGGLGGAPGAPRSS